MVRNVNGKKAKDYLGETIECPLCGEKLVSMERHFCGARNNNYDNCKLKNVDLKDNKVYEYFNHKIVTQKCRDNGCCNHELDDKMVGPYWTHKGNKNVYKHCPFYLPSNHHIITLKEWFKDYIGDKYITPELDDTHNIGKRIINNYGFCINLKSFKEVYDVYGDELIYIMRYDIFDGYSDGTRKALFRDYGDKKGTWLLLKHDNDNNGFGFRFINYNPKTGEYTTTFAGSFERFLKKVKK